MGTQYEPALSGVTGDDRMAHEWTDAERAYFECEAVRLLIPAGDNAYHTAVANIAEDGGRKWRAWLAANDWCYASLQTAYERSNTQLQHQAAARKAELAAAFDRLIAEGLTRNQAAKRLIRERPALRGYKPVHLLRKTGR